MSRDAIQMRVRTKPFQKLIGENLAKFENFLKSILESKKYGKRTLLKHAKFLLTHSETHTFGLPYPIASSLASKAPELMFVLLYRLLHKRDDLKSGGELHRRMLGVITLFLWFGKSDGQRDHSKLLASIWPSVLRLETEQFWSSSTVERASLNEILPDIPTLKHLSKLVGNTTSVQSNSTLQGKIFTDDRGVIERAFFLRDLVLFAQRDFLAMNFKEEHFGRDDANVPFDWDHISPHSLIKKKGIPKPIKECYHTNGNLRAWPYSLNRMDQDDSPDKKLNPLSRDDSIKIAYSWSKYYTRIKRKYDQKSLAKDIQKWSYCDRTWLQCNTQDLKDRTSWQKVFKSIINRNVNIYREWYTELQIDKLTIAITNGTIESLIDKRRWKSNIKEYKARFDFDSGRAYWINLVRVQNIEYHFYISYPKSRNRLSILGENQIEFGIFQNKNLGMLSDVDILEEKELQYIKK